MRALAALFCLLPGAAKAADCALALILALDISASVNAREYEIQKGGLARALEDPEIRAAILADPGSVWLAAFEWSGWQQQDLIMGWAQITDAAALARFAAGVGAHQRRYAEFSTALGFAVDHAIGLFGGLPATCARRVIDVSGDGVNNDGHAPNLTPLAPGLTINGLAIKGAEPDPEAYYRDHVIRGPGAFLMVARNGFEDYPDMIKGKLLREIAEPVLIGALR